MTSTTTPAVKATNGLPPVGANSRSRVVKPILRKQKANAQVRNAVIGATKAGLTILLNSPYEALPTAQVMTIDAIRKPMTNFGKRKNLQFLVNGPKPVVANTRPAASPAESVSP